MKVIKKKVKVHWAVADELAQAAGKDNVGPIFELNMKSLSHH